MKPLYAGDLTTNKDYKMFDVVELETAIEDCDGGYFEVQELRDILETMHAHGAIYRGTYNRLVNKINKLDAGQ